MMQDMTGQPRSDADLQEALQVLARVAVKDALTLPYLTLNIGNIRDLLRELQQRRAADVPTDEPTPNGNQYL